MYVWVHRQRRRQRSMSRVPPTTGAAASSEARTQIAARVLGVCVLRTPSRVCVCIVIIVRSRASVVVGRADFVSHACHKGVACGRRLRQSTAVGVAVAHHYGMCRTRSDKNQLHVRHANVLTGTEPVVDVVVVVVVVVAAESCRHAVEKSVSIVADRLIIICLSRCRTDRYQRPAPET